MDQGILSLATKFAFWLRNCILLQKVTESKWHQRSDKLKRKMTEL